MSETANPSLTEQANADLSATPARDFTLRSAFALSFSDISPIVAISSELALAGSATDLHYVAAKGAVLGLVKSLAMEVAHTAIRVNAVAPGPTDTPLLARDSLWRRPEYLATLPLGRLVTPEEIAHTVHYLATEGSMYCGEVLSPNAGAVI
jgi:2-hydroxycyclohexanecarboxyl-CoA dehydrogenase